MSDITELKQKTDDLLKCYVWQMIIESIIRGSLSLIVLFIVVFVRKRRELFLWMIPLLFAVNNILNTYLAINVKPDFSAISEQDYNQVVLQVANAAFVFAHWVFGSQYLQTSFILPKCFENSHLNLSLENFEESLQLPGGANFT